MLVRRRGSAQLRNHAARGPADVYLARPGHEYSRPARWRGCYEGRRNLGSTGDDRYAYSADSARRYGSLGIEGTTYEIGFDAVRELLGDITRKTFLDFGCGAGRSTAFLRALGADYVYGVDHDRNMLEAARSREVGGATFLFADDAIPLPGESVDGAVSMSVFVEIRTLSQMARICAQVARVLRPGSPFIVESSNPMAFGHSFRSYRYPQAAESLRSGSRTPCIVTTSEGQVVIQDT